VASDDTDEIAALGQGSALSSVDTDAPFCACRSRRADVVLDRALWAGFIDACCVYA